MKKNSSAKRFFKRNTHNDFFKALAGFGRAMNRLYENRNHDIYSNGEYTVLKKLVSHKPGIIIDGGANVGHYSLLLHKLMPQTTIYAFEPVSATFEKLVKNTQNIPTINPIQKGLFKDNGTKKINLFKSNTHSSLVNIQGLHYDSTHTEEIELIKGDDFLSQYSLSTIDLLKIDVEGAEYDVLQGFEDSIKDGRIRMIQFEYGYINITTKKLLLDFYDYLTNKGYLIGKIYPKKVAFRPYSFKHENFLGSNYVALKKDEQELFRLLSL